MFKEACEIVHRMFTEDRPVFEGEFYTIDGPINEPKGVQKPHPPIWIGGGGERVTLKLVARWGDASNFSGDIDTIKHKLEVLKGHCENEGRPYEDITPSTSRLNRLDKDPAVRLAENDVPADSRLAPARFASV